MNEVTKAEFKILLDIRKLKRQLGFADTSMPSKMMTRHDLIKKRDRLQRMVKYCEKI